MPDIADVHEVAAYQNLSGSTAPFSLPVGFYWIDFDPVDPNAGTTVAVIDVTNGNTTLCTASPNSTGHPLIGGPLGGAGFQVGPGVSLKLTVANGIAQSIVIQG